MRCPTIQDLPDPPPGRTGWPWTEETRQLPSVTLDGSLWPRISIVTPSYNQGQFIEETIRSVLLQGYPDLEYRIIDGGSTDGTVALIKKYERWLVGWVSEPDRGQADAINKGLQACSGTIFQWINSDDVLLPGALEAVASALGDHHAVAGNVVNFDEAGREDLVVQAGLTAPNLIYPGASFHQPGLWLLSDLVRACGGVNVNLRYVFDWDLAIRYLALFPDVVYLGQPLVRFRFHPRSKTVAEPGQFAAEVHRVVPPLLADERFASLARTSRLFLRQHAWYATVNTLRTGQREAAFPRLLLAARLVILACRDPRVRFSRYTAGAVRRASPLRLSWLRERLQKLLSGLRTRVSPGALIAVSSHPAHWNRLLVYGRTLRRYRAMERAECGSNRPLRIYPCLEDESRKQTVGFYFYQDCWAARQVFREMPNWLVDVGSTTLLAGILSQFTECVEVDIRPLDAELDGLSSISGSLLNLPFADGTVPCLTTMCVIEHVGLGRYGDELTPSGTERAAHEIARVVTPGGLVVYSVPVGATEMVEFNANRRFTYRQARELFAGWDLVDACVLTPVPEPADVLDRQLLRRGLVACFAVRKPGDIGPP